MTLRGSGPLGRLALVGTMVCVLTWTSYAHGEVGVTTDDSGSATLKPSGPYVLRIIEDPTPFGSVWRRFSTSPSRAVLNEQGEANADGVGATGVGASNQ